MAPNEPKEPNQGDVDIDNLFSEDSADDLFISQSLKTLPGVEVPSAFLPNVMFQVYEYHHRERVSLPTVALFSSVLLVVACGLFAWDVSKHVGSGEHASFSHALDWKLDRINHFSSEMASAVSNVLISSWRVVSGAVGLFVKDTPITIQLITLAGVLAIIFLARRYLGRLE